MQASDAFGPVSSPLAKQIAELTCDLDWTLAHFAFVAHATTLEAESDIAHSPSMSVASSHHSQPLPSLAFLGDSAELLATYATFLVDPGTEIELIVNETQRDVAQAAFDVQHIEPLWQMVFRGDASVMEARRVRALTDNDLPSMQMLAQAVNMQLRFVAKNPFEQGPTFGIWEGRTLIAIGTTLVRACRIAHIGNIVGHDAQQSDIVAALIKAHVQNSTTVFAIVPQSDKEAIRRFEDIGFVRERSMYQTRCILETVQHSD
jgi:hypothetical protein